MPQHLLDLRYLFMVQFMMIRPLLQVFNFFIQFLGTNPSRRTLFVQIAAKNIFDLGNLGIGKTMLAQFPNRFFKRLRVRIKDEK